MIPPPPITTPTHVPPPPRVPDVERVQALALAWRVTVSRPRTRAELSEAVTQRPGGGR